MKLSIIGTIVNDRILHVDGEETRSLGGIYYTVAVAASLCPPDWEIIPVCRVGRDILPRVLDQLSRYKNVRTDGIIPARRENTRVTLVYTSQNERTEYTTSPMAPLSTAELSLAFETEASLVNFITGKDVTLSALQELRSHTNTFLYIDFHTLALGIGENGVRYYRYPRLWRKYALLPDVLQMNENEAACLARIRRQNGQVDAIRQFFMDFLLHLKEGPKAVVVTLGERGALVLHRTRPDHVRSEIVSGLPVEVEDPTGCGDTFAIAFLIKYLETLNPFEAARYANRAAGLKCTLRGSADLTRLRSLVSNQWE